MLRDSKEGYILGDGKKVEIFDQNLKLIASLTIDNCCGLVHDGYIYIGGQEGITVLNELDYSVVKQLFNELTLDGSIFTVSKIVSSGKWIIAVGKGPAG